MMRRHVFASMGTGVVVLGPAGARSWNEAVDLVEGIFGEDHHRFTRFDRRSELSGVNRRAGEWVDVSAQFAEVLALALAAALRSGGLFDPTILEELEAAGYDRDLSEARALPDRAAGPVRPDRWRKIAVEGRRVRLPADVRIDLGGIVKGWTVDRAVEAAAGVLPWVLVSAGGDLRVEGDLPGGGIEVAVEEPHDPGAMLLRLLLAGGALATSSVTRRSWGPGLHHVIDPRTGRPADSTALQVTVWAETCALAEVRATEALLRGPGALVGIPGLMVTETGIHTTFREDAA